MRLLWNIKILLILLLATCGSKSSYYPIKAHYLVNITYLGAYPPNENISINEIAFTVMGCKNFPKQKVSIKPSDNNFMLNLYKSDKNCSVQLNFLKVTVNDVPDILELNSNTYCGTTTKLCIDITLKTNLPQSLQEQGEIKYDFLPFFKEDLTNIASVILPENSSNYPKLIPRTITNLGIGNTGKQQIGVIFECSEALVFWNCALVPLKSYLLKLIPTPTIMLTEQELFTLMTPSANVMIPNESHCYGNGVRMTFEIEPTLPLNLLLITSANSVIRYFNLNIN